MSELSVIEQRIRTFPAIPAICARLIGQLGNPDLSMQDLAGEIRYDPGLTANILHLANSSYYGAPHSVGSLREAAVLIGLNKIVQLVMARGMAGVLRRPLSGYELQPEEMLLHAVWVAVAAEEFCQLTRQRLPQTIFTAGLLHDLGKLVLDDFVKERRAELQAHMDDNQTQLPAAETAVLGINHAEAGARLLEQWNFPEELSTSARLHHTPAHAGHFAVSVNIIHLANTLAHTVGIGAGWTGAASRSEPAVLEQLRLRHTDVEYVASRTLNKMRILHNTLVA